MFVSTTASPLVSPCSVLVVTFAGEKLEMFVTNASGTNSSSSCSLLSGSP